MEKFTKPVEGQYDDLMWTPFETTTFRDSIVIGTHYSAPLIGNADPLDLIWDLH